MPINFPNNPSLNQVYVSNTKSWVFNGYGWKSYDAVGTVANTSSTQITATNGQTVFNTPTYVQGRNEIRVFINGVRQNNVSDYVETSTSSITLTSNAVAGDNVAFEVSTYAGSPWNIGYPNVINNTSTNANLFPLFTNATSGGINVVNVSNTKLTYNPSTGKLNAQSIGFPDGTSQSTAASPEDQYARNTANAAFTTANAAFAAASNVSSSRISNNTTSISIANTGTGVITTNVSNFTVTTITANLISHSNSVIENVLFRASTKNITSNITISNTYNHMSIGPMTIDNNVVVIIADGGEWVIV
jgi:hypothetical protein